MRKSLLGSMLVAMLLSPAVRADKPTKVAFVKEKEAVVASIEKHREELIHLSDQIWKFAETALKETKSAKLLSDYAEQQGFRVERGVAGMPTAFIASYGEGRPIIGILGEYDALPGISQKAIPTKEPLEKGAAGHGCGHNLFGAASMGAAVAIKEQIAAGRLKGTVRFYGTPAEEAIGGKLYMAREGLFNDLDACLAWHPSQENVADTESSQAIISFFVEFYGKASHAAFDPWSGKSAVDGLEIFTHAVNLMREHIRPTSRIHYTILAGGDVPNVVPEYAKLWCWVRDSRRSVVEDLLERSRKIAEGAALAASVEQKLTIETGNYEMLPSFAGARMAHANMTWLGPLSFTEEEQEFAKKIQRATGAEEKGLITEIKAFDPDPGEPEGGSTDVADVSWLVPTIHLSVTTAPVGTPWHGWPVVASGGMSIGHKGMIYAAKSLAATMVDLYLDVKNREALKKEFQEKTKGTEYKSYLPDGPPVLPSE